MNNSTTCVDSFLPTIYFLPSAVVLSILFPMVVAGVFLNAFVMSALLRQKRLTNQDVYVFVLCLSSFFMIGPVFLTNTLRSWFNCQKFPRVFSDLLVFGQQVPAGVNVWLTCCISIDRLLIVYYHTNYLSKETKFRVAAKIATIIAVHSFAGMYSNFIQYLPYAVTAYVNPLEIPQVRVSKPTTELVQTIDKYLNLVRLVSDRLVPWLLCPATYLAVFVLRNRQKIAVQQAPVGASGVGVTEARQRAERRIRRSRKLVVGISASVFVSLLPETVLDFANYATSVNLRSRAPVVGMIWYLANIIDPVICIVSLSSLSKKACKTLAKMGFKCWSANLKVTLVGTTGGGMSHK